MTSSDHESGQSRNRKGSDSKGNPRSPVPLTNTTTTHPNLLKNLKLKQLLLCYKIQIILFKNFNRNLFPALRQVEKSWVKRQHITFDKSDMAGLVSTGFLVIWVGSHLSNPYPAIPIPGSDANGLGQPNGPADTDQSWPQPWLRFYWPSFLGHGLLVQSSCSFLNLRTKIRCLNMENTTNFSVIVTLEDHPTHLSTPQKSCSSAVSRSDQCVQPHWTAHCCPAVR